MQKDHSQRWNIAEIALSALVLFILLFFTYGIFVRALYAGFRYIPTDGLILTIFVESHQTPTLQKNDMLIRVGDVLWTEYKKDGRVDLFKGVKTGDIVDIVVMRNNQELIIPWKIPGFNQEEFTWRFFNIWWLPYFYWTFGTITLLFMRPRDTIRSLLIAANYLTGLFLIFGSLSAWHIWESSILLHATAWLILPVYLHLHWIFPKPLYTVSKQVLYLFYGISTLFALAELIQVPPKSFYALAFLFAFIGSAGLQAFHFIKRPEQRREVGLLAISISLVIIPFIVFLISGITSNIAYLTFLTLPFMPLSYFYIIYRHKMGGLELRANRLISSYAFLIILGTGLLLLLGPVTLLPISHEALTFLTITFTLVITFLCTMAFPAFQAFVEQRILGIKLPYQNLQEIYSSRIAVSVSMPSLLLLLEEEIFPSLLVRQFAFFQILNGSNLNMLLMKNVAATELPGENDVNTMIARSGKYIPNFSSEGEWIRLILPLKVGENLIGIWLLGRRDPDDLYLLAEIPIFQSLANQTAIALSNIMHAEQLRKMYQTGTERYENERMRLGLDLHDSILNELAVLRNNLDEVDPSSKFEVSYKQVTQRLREIVSDLRPPMLIYGLSPALQELADNLMERSGDKIRIKVDIQTSGERIPQNIEQHIFRITQEACQNTLRHAQAKTVKIFGVLTPQQVDLHIEDDGIGFDVNAQLEKSNQPSNNHFGLAGMVERSHLIGAGFNLHSRPQEGTKIHIAWKNVSEKAQSAIF
jgi:signal transduction histidine kinase